MQDNMQHLASSTTGLTKIARYKWLLKDQPGEFMMVDKNDLTVDPDYQRKLSKPRVLNIAKDWAWSAFGVLLVAYREKEGQFYVFDGQHRCVAAMHRDDIKTVPCLIFEFKDKESEAKAFLKINTHRRMPSSIDQFDARLYAKEPEAMLIQGLCESTNREISSSGKKRSVKCVRVLLKWAKKDSTLLVNMWPVLDEVVGDSYMNHSIVAGLMYIESHLPFHKSLTLNKWRKRLMKVGAEALLEGSEEGAKFYKNSGDKVWALGMLQVINKGLKEANKLVLKDD